MERKEKVDTGIRMWSEGGGETRIRPEVEDCLLEAGDSGGWRALFWPLAQQADLKGRGG